MIYLDHAATTLPKPQCVINAVSKAMKNTGSLGRSGHEAAQKASETAYLCRQEAASMFSCSPEQVVFTMNATHGLNIAIKSLISPQDKVVISGFEHNAVIRPLFKQHANVVTAGTQLFNQDEAVTAFSSAIDSNTKAVVCTHVSNVFGYVLPIERISDICMERGVPLIIDASQSAGVLPVDMNALKAAFIAMPGHKGLYGPQGTGLLLCGKLPETLIEGGTGSSSLLSQMPDFLPDRAEAGTQNIHGAAGLLAGLRFIKGLSMEKILSHEKMLIDYLSHEIDLDRYNIYTGDPQVGVISLLPYEKSIEEFERLLSENGFAVRTGLHCAPVAHASAGTLSTGTVRVSVSAMTTRNDIEKFLCFVNNI